MKEILQKALKKRKGSQKGSGKRSSALVRIKISLTKNLTSKDVETVNSHTCSVQGWVGIAPAIPT
jgi:hypothetical protein